MAKDKCILCGKDSPYEMDVNIDYRHGYIEGAGQLCTNCYQNGTNREMITIPKNMVLDNPNDQLLGAAVRRFYYENY